MRNVLRIYLESDIEVFDFFGYFDDTYMLNESKAIPVTMRTMQEVLCNFNWKNKLKGVYDTQYICIAKRI